MLRTWFRAGLVRGIPVNWSTMSQALAEVAQLVAFGPSRFVCFLEANLLYRAREPQVRETIGRAALVYPDGIAVAKLLAWSLRCPVSRVSGPSFLLAACDYGRSRNWRHFFLGGGPGVAEQLARKLQEKFPGLQVVGTHSPPFRELSEEEELELVRTIEAAHPDLLWVGLGGPKQEFWMARQLGRIRVPVMLGVGAAFDFHSGNRPWAPRWVRRCGLEWLFRMISGGRRTCWRNLKCVSFVAGLLGWSFLRNRIWPGRAVSLFPRYPEGMAFPEALPSPRAGAGKSVPGEDSRI